MGNQLWVLALGPDWPCQRFLGSPAAMMEVSAADSEVILEPAAGMTFNVCRIGHSTLIQECQMCPTSTPVSFAFSCFVLICCIYIFLLF